MSLRCVVDLYQSVKDLVDVPKLRGVDVLLQQFGCVVVLCELTPHVFSVLPEN